VAAVHTPIWNLDRLTEPHLTRRSPVLPRMQPDNHSSPVLPRMHDLPLLTRSAIPRTVSPLTRAIYSNSLFSDRLSCAAFHLFPSCISLSVSLPVLVQSVSLSAPLPTFRPDYRNKTRQTDTKLLNELKLRKRLNSWSSLVTYWESIGH
jgi:hypothetical protein